jgi:MFS transporter, MHS family, proline/betaine transporter
MLPLVIFYSAEQAVTPVMIVEMFSGKGRYTGISLAYNLCMATAGGLSPAINTWLTQHFHHLWMMAYYIMFCALVSLWVCLRHVPDEFGVETELTVA